MKNNANKNIELSIIVPVYNVEKYIRKCLDSLLEIKNLEYEIIVINDGSTDNSKEILLEYCRNNPEIRLINKENGGLSSARNVGIKYSNGKYITFVDSDDFIESYYINKLYNIAEKNNLDIIRGKYIFYYEENNTFKHSSKVYRFENKVLTGIDILNEYINNDCYEVVCWTSVYKLNYIKNNNLYFCEGAFFEDQDFTLRALAQLNNRVMQTNYNYYYYRQREQSITKTVDINKILDFIKSIDNQYSHICKKNCYKQIGYETLYITLNHLIQFSYKYLDKNERKYVWNKIKERTYLLDDIDKIRNNNLKIKTKLYLNYYFINEILYKYKYIIKRK